MISPESEAIKPKIRPQPKIKAKNVQKSEIVIITVCLLLGVAAKVTESTLTKREM